MFLVKQPSIKSCVLNIELCPPHDLDHVTESYPIYIMIPCITPIITPKYFPNLKHSVPGFKLACHRIVTFAALAVLFTSQQQFCMMMNVTATISLCCHQPFWVLQCASVWTQISCSMQQEWLHWLHHGWFVCTENTALQYEDLLDHLSSTMFPIGCPRNHASVLAAAF